VATTTCGGLEPEISRCSPVRLPTLKPMPENGGPRRLARSLTKALVGETIHPERIPASGRVRILSAMGAANASDFPLAVGAMSKVGRPPMIAGMPWS